MDKKTRIRNLAAIVLIAFGILTLFLSSAVIFDFLDIRAKEGNYVLFIVWANFICSVIYLVSAYGFINKKPWATLLLGLAVAILVGAFIALKVFISNGGIYETKTVGAMVFRTIVTLLFAIVGYYTIQKNKLKM